MIAIAKPRKAATRRAKSTSPRAASRAAAEKARRLADLRARRERLFARQIDYIPCRQFLKADAERLATEPPAEAAVPLERSDAASPAGAGLTPYIASLYQTRLLAKPEEQFYFRRMNWLKFKASTSRGRLDRRRASLRQIEQVEGFLNEAETVKAILITANLRLVVSIAKKFVDPTWGFDELVSEGNLALMRAVEKFNFALGNRFSTYATYAIQRHFYRLSQRGRQLRKRFVADDEALKDRAEKQPEHEFCSTEQIGLLKELFAGFLAELEPRERKIVVARFGFDGKAPRTFRELGTQMGVCKERIRQILLLVPPLAVAAYSLVFYGILPGLAALSLLLAPELLGRAFKRKLLPPTMTPWLRQAVFISVPVLVWFVVSRSMQGLDPGAAGPLALAAGSLAFLIFALSGQTVTSWRFALLFTLYPCAAYLLLLGGGLGLPLVETDRWGGMFLTLVIAGIGIATEKQLTTWGERIR